MKKSETRWAVIGRHGQRSSHISSMARTRTEAIKEVCSYWAPKKIKPHNTWRWLKRTYGHKCVRVQISWEE